MVARAQERLEGADIRPYIVAAGSTVRKGHPVKLSGENVVETAAVTDDTIGISLDDGDGDDASKSTIRVIHPGKGVVKARVGTGGATAGHPAKWASGGLTDATVGGGTTKLVVCGQFMDTGVAGDLVGLNLGAFSFTVGS